MPDTFTTMPLEAATCAADVARDRAGDGAAHLRAGDPAAALAAMLEVESSASTAAAVAVRLMLDGGASWADIAGVSGTTEDAARTRWAHVTHDHDL